MIDSALMSSRCFSRGMIHFPSFHKLSTYQSPTEKSVGWKSVFQPAHRDLQAVEYDSNDAPMVDSQSVTAANCSCAFTGDQFNIDAEGTGMGARC
jgi:hypothetical protein